VIIGSRLVVWIGGSRILIQGNCCLMLPLFGVAVIHETEDVVYYIVPLVSDDLV